MTIPDPTIDRLKEFLESNPSREELEGWLKKLPPHEHLACISYLVQISPTDFVRVIDSEFAFRNAEALADEDLFAELAKASADGINIDGRKISIIDLRHNPEPISRFASLYNEAVRRGFKRQEIFDGMKVFSTLRARLGLAGPEDPEWRRFEKLVARIHKSFCEDADVRWSEQILDSSGRSRQIDVTVRQHLGPHQVMMAIECKHQRRPVELEEVEAFITKSTDLHANVAIIVSSSGFQEGAREKALSHDVRIWTLEEAEKVSWREELRTVQLFYPFPESIQIVPQLPPEVIPEGTHVPFDAMVVMIGSGRLSMSSVVARAIQEAAERCLPVPCVFRATFPEAARLEFRAGIFPIRAVDFNFTRKILFTHKQSIKVPTGAVYRFSDATGKRTYSVREADLPVMDGVDRNRVTGT